MKKSNNRDRLQRLLDAANELFVHYGFDKTTMSEVARQAGVSKGAIYLHFDSKEELFEALLKQEMVRYNERWIDLVDADPKGGTIAGMYRNILLALNSSDMMIAIMKQDVRVLGSYLRHPDSMFRRSNTNTRFEFVRMMQQAGAIREDVDAKVTAHILNMLTYGLVAIGDVMNAEDAPPLDQVIEGIADLLDRALAPADGDGGEAAKAVLRQLSSAARQRHGL